MKDRCELYPSAASPPDTHRYLCYTVQMLYLEKKTLMFDFRPSVRHLECCQTFKKANAGDSVQFVYGHF